jgi:diamine N-acetyltransferase
MSINKAENNILLRALEPFDLEVLYKWENDREIWKISNTIVPFSRFVLQKYIENSHLDIYETKQLRMMIDTINSDKSQVSVGAVDLFDFDPYHQRAGIGILIGETQNRNKGLASAALDEIVSYSFDKLLLHQLYANITTDNEASMRVFQKAGFTQSGIKRDWVKISGGYVDEAIYQLINPVR